jgi:hypothetical protein
MVDSLHAGAAPPPEILSVLILSSQTPDLASQGLVAGLHHAGASAAAGAACDLGTQASACLSQGQGLTKQALTDGPVRESR